MTALGVWSCRWRELRPINFGGSTAAASSDNGSGNGGPSTNPADGGHVLGDEEQGFIRGGRRGRGRDGAGEYEMVGLTKNDVER
jgi:protein SYS1